MLATREDTDCVLVVGGGIAGLATALHLAPMPVVLLAAAPLGTTGRVLMLGRPGGPEFRPSEIARLGYLAGIIATVLS